MPNSNTPIRVPGTYAALKPSLVMSLCLVLSGASGMVLLFSDANSKVALGSFFLLVVCLGALTWFTYLMYEQSERVLQFEDTIAAITDIYWQWDLKSGAFEYSGRMAELLGYDDRKPTDGFWKEIIHPVDRPMQKYQLLRHLADESVPYYCEYRFLDCNQRYQWFAGRGKVVRRDQDHQPILMVGSIEHIQPRKDMEQTLIQSHKMEALGQLTGGIAHDFNNILGTVLGFAELSLEVRDAEKAREYAGHIHAAGTRARDVVRQLLDFSRRSKGDEETINLIDEIESAMVIIRSTLPSAITIEEQFTGPARFAHLDPTQLQRMLLNLSINARDAMDGQGTMNISLEPVARLGHCASCEKDFSGRYLMLSVTDTGHGFDLDAQSRLFEPFFTTKPFGEGTGMGLSVVHGMVHEFGGHIEVESHPGKGTRFCLYIPEAEALEMDAVSAEPG